MADLAPTAPAPTVDPRRAALDDPRLTAAGLLFEVTNGLAGQLASQISDAGVSMSEFEVLLRLSRSDGTRLRMSDLATQANLSSSGLTRLVDRLEARGLVARQACPSDGRGSFAVLSADGLELLLSIMPGHVALIDRWYTSTLPPEQLRQITAALRVVRAVVRPGAEAGA
ncbi:MAG TPA: MarR family transcriptional regulator [Iamia sp.]|nr:MarR family transcriptional regulator [Iamia sp.]